MGLAVHNYESATGKLPGAGEGTVGTGTGFANLQGYSGSPLVPGANPGDGYYFHFRRRRVACRRGFCASGREQHPGP